MSISWLQLLACGAVAACDCGFSASAGRATRAGFAGGHVLGFGLEVLHALLPASGRSGIKSVTNSLAGVAHSSLRAADSGDWRKSRVGERGTEPRSASLVEQYSPFYIKLAVLLHCLGERL